MKTNKVKVQERKAQLEATRKQKYESSMKYTRYIYIRYFLAILFFANLYWLATLLVAPSVLVLVPILMMVLVFVPYFKMMKLQNNPEEETGRIAQFFLLNVVVTMLEIICLWINAHAFFPYIQATPTNQVILTVILSVSIVLSLLSIKQLSRIGKNEDKISQRLAELKEYTL